ncbi:hypothetical protein ACIOWI_33065 [Streptomyces sp. NPDC087659]|uniref:hypothetical protein n=1 Tax=Streptomyces sp. NPDC087659 TaxID=3365801 RepID=UPI0037F2C065
MSYSLESCPSSRPPAAVAEPSSAPLSGPVELYAERTEAEPVVYVPDAYGRMVPVRRSQADALIAAIPATLPRDLTPRPLIDSRAQIVLAGGLGTGAAAAGVGYGLGQILAPLAAVATSGTLWVLALAAVLASAVRRTPTRTTYVTNNHIHARWWGRAHAANR